MTKAAAYIDLSEEAKRATEVLGEPRNSVSCIYDDDFRDYAEPHEADGGKRVTDSLHLLLCNPPYNMTHQSKLESTDHDIFEPNDVDDFCDLAKLIIRPGVHGHVFCSVPQCSS